MKINIENYIGKSTQDLLEVIKNNIEVKPGVIIEDIKTIPIIISKYLDYSNLYFSVDFIFKNYPKCNCSLWFEINFDNNTLTMDRNSCTYSGDTKDIIKLLL